MNIKKVLGGVFAGVATGAVVGLLFAPHKGKSTRRRIIEKGESYIADFEEVMTNYMEMVNKKMEGMKMEINHIRTNGKAKVDDTMADVVNAKMK